MTNFPSNITDLTKLQQQVIALAGMVQSASLVHDIAQTGQYDYDNALVCLRSLFVTQPESFAAIFANPAIQNEETNIDTPRLKQQDLQKLNIDAINNLRLGLNNLEKLLQQNKELPLVELTRYLIGVIHLQRKLAKQPKVMTALAKQLDIADGQADYFGIEHENVSASLAEIYTNHVSQLGYRIKVTGNPIYLQQTAIASRVRSFLLAGIRCAILWRQVGGRRWQFIIGKQRMLTTIQHLQTFYKS